MVELVAIADESKQGSLFALVSEGSVKEETSIIWQEGLQYWDAFLAHLPMIVIGLVLLLFIILIARPLSEILIRPIGYFSSSQLIRLVVRRTIRVIIVLFGVYLFLRFAGLSEFAVAILSGTGVMGLIIGFAFKDIAENFISSLLLSVQKPFKIDDVIEIEGQIGVVRQVTARATTLVDFDGNHIQIPNSTVYKNVIRNFTANPKLRGNFVIGVGYDSSIIESQKIAMNVLESTDSVLNDPEPQVLVDALASSTANLRVYFWINSHDYSLLKVSSLLMRTITREFEINGISMPDDAREIIFPQGINVFQNDKAHLDNASLVNGSIESEASESKQAVEDDVEVEDLSSDAEDIRQQAKEARDPESGKNII